MCFGGHFEFSGHIAFGSESEWAPNEDVFRIIIKIRLCANFHNLVLELNNGLVLFHQSTALEGFLYNYLGGRHLQFQSELD